MSCLPSQLHYKYTVFSLLGPPRGGGGGAYSFHALLKGGRAYLRGGFNIYFLKLFLQHNNMCVKQLCILTILTQL